MRTLCRYSPRDRGCRDVSLQDTHSPVGCSPCRRGASSGSVPPPAPLQSGRAPSVLLQGQQPQITWVLECAHAQHLGLQGHRIGSRSSGIPSTRSGGSETPAAMSLCPLPLAHGPSPGLGAPEAPCAQPELRHAAQPPRLARPRTGIRTDTSSNSEAGQLLCSPRLIGITQEQSLCLPGTILRSGQDKGELCLPWELDPSSHPQGWTVAGAPPRGEGSSTHPHHPPARWGGRREGSAGFLPPKPPGRQPAVAEGWEHGSCWGTTLTCILKVT